MKIKASWGVGALVATTALALVSCQSMDQPVNETGKQKAPLTTGSLPGDVAVNVSIDTPSNGALVGSGPVTISGTASVAAAPALSTDLVYVVDTSGSTEEPGCGGNQNGDLVSDTILDCEIQALRNANDQVVAAGSVANVGLVTFSEGALIKDVGAAPGVQQLAPPDSSGVAAAFSSIGFGVDATNFGQGIVAAGTVLSGSPAARKLVLFISDGASTFNDPTVADAVMSSLSPDTIVNAVAVTNIMGTNCDTNRLGRGSLRELTTLRHGICVDAATIANVPNLVPTLVVSQLTAVTLKIDSVPTPITISPALPQNGPASVTWTTTLSSLSPGPHQLCATATGKNAGQPGSVDECITIHVNQPPVAKCHDLSLTAGPACNAGGSVNDGSFDPDGNLVGCVQSPAGPFGQGSTAVTLTCTDALGASSSCTSTVTVVDGTGPVVTTAPPITLWPPNHKYVTVSLDQCIASAVDACDGDLSAASGSIVNVTSDEAEDSNGSGNTCDDIALVDHGRVNLRAEREGGGDGRVYTIHFTVSDHSGNSTPGTCRVLVPHNQGSGAADSGPAFCVGSACGALPGHDPACDGHGH